ncbi:MAG: HAMP domain-containing histidine kinase [Aquificae bacterium]|nr:HAMP domain-containing histidine kinase [Aquificota bacterium]
MSLIEKLKKLLPKNRYEREAILKSFLIFFLTVELLVGVIFVLLIRIEIDHLKHNVFLELVNYSYTFKGEEFGIEVVEIKKDTQFYVLKEDEEGLYILIPVPGVETDALKIIYPRERFAKDVRNILLQYGLLFLLFSALNALVSLALALYAIRPLRRAVELISDITKDIAHDMNTPLTSLLINLKILKSRYNDEVLDRMQMAINQLKYLSENLTPLTKEVSLSTEEVNLAKLIKETLRDFSSIYPDIKLYTELKEVKLQADRRVLKRIVDNLVSNAFRHNVKEGWVRVSLKDGQLVIENTSRPLKNIDRIFERFYRESQRGMGLGLSVVKRLADEMGWEVKAEQRDGVFRIKILFHGRKGSDRYRRLLKG